MSKIDNISLAVSNAQSEVLIELITNYFSLQSNALATLGTLFSSGLEIAEEYVRSRTILREQDLKAHQDIRRDEIQLSKTTNDRSHRKSIRDYKIRKAELQLEQNRLAVEHLKTVLRMKEVDASVAVPDLNPLFQSKDDTVVREKKTVFTDENSVWVNPVEESQKENPSIAKLKNAFKDVQGAFVTSVIQSPLHKNLNSQAKSKSDEDQTQLVAPPSNKPFAWEDVENPSPKSESPKQKTKADSAKKDTATNKNNAVSKKKKPVIDAEE
jgi:hypothetical protein